MGNEIKNKRIAKCNNIKCSAFYSLEFKEVLHDQAQLCDLCKAKSLHSHLVQCENCLSIINFIPLFKQETAIVFYVKKCSVCSGTAKDEKKLTPNYFPEAYI